MVISSLMTSLWVASPRRSTVRLLQQPSMLCLKNLNVARVQPGRQVLLRQRKPTVLRNLHRQIRRVATHKVKRSKNTKPVEKEGHEALFFSACQIIACE